MKKIAWIVLIALAAAVIALTTWIGLSHSDESTSGAESDAPSWLFSLSADSGTMTKTADGGYDLVLTGADDAFTAFTDRPNRETAIIPLSRAMQAWPQVFAESAPNAVIVEHEPSGESDSFVVELTEPRLIDSSTITFHAVLVTNQVQPASTKNVASSTYATPPAVFKEASLFIDDVTTTTVSFPPMSVCTSPAGKEITPPGSITTSSDNGNFDESCKSAGGTVMNTPGEYQTIP
jgi:hypothetical protein